jgi:hypothetical protein
MAGKLYVDLDGTLAHYETFKGHSHIGEPIPHMVHFVKDAMKKGWPVKIFTARAEDPTAIPFIRQWLIEVFGPEEGFKFEITNVKKQDGALFIDDRAIRIDKNTGQACCVDSHAAMHYMKDNYIKHEVETDDD